MSERGAALVLSRRDGAVARITLNRPERLNAFFGTMRDDLAAAVNEAAAAPEVRVIVITGAGRAFCAGADVEVMERLLSAGDQEGFADLVQAGVRVVRAVRLAPQPVVAAVNGVAAGAGASLAAACDLRIAADSASIGFTFNKIGLHPDWGATYFLPRLVGSGRAAELLLSARIVSAEEAMSHGLFQRVAPAAQFEAAVEETARQLAGKPPLALARLKATLAGPRAQAALDEALQLEAEAQMECFRSADVREGIAAFREKREPRFQGR
ncbi:MAG TPA: enoyl-CoA hydratase-related protein [Longimicrobiaceae bacterium]|nr:enoyl-CoA hydratase-related protein [Longimicrobiaceae bacterium]